MRNCIIKRDKDGNVKVYNSIIMKKMEQDKINFQIIGEKGASQIQEYKQSLDKAKDMYSKGVRQTLISEETGWYKSKDGWKYLSKEIVEQFKIKKYEENKRLTLKEVLGNENILFKTYPHMAEVEVIFINDSKQIPLGIEKLPKDVIGTFMEDKNSIRLSTNEQGLQRTLGQIQNTLGHEVSHYIQLVEGFAKGGSYNSILDEALQILGIEKNDRYLNDIRKDIQEADKSKLTENEKKIVDDSLYTILAMEQGNNSYLYTQYSHILGEIDANIVGQLSQNNEAIGTYEDLLSLYLNENNIKIENVYFLRNGDVRFQIIGEKDNLNQEDIASLQEAKQMFSQGLSNIEVFNKTKWFKTKNGVLRREVDDVKLKPNVNIDRLISEGQQIYNLKDLVDNSTLEGRYNKDTAVNIKIKETNEKVDINGVAKGREEYNIIEIEIEIPKTDDKNIRRNAIQDYFKGREFRTSGKGIRFEQVLNHELTHLLQLESGRKVGNDYNTIYKYYVRKHNQELQGLTPQEINDKLSEIYNVENFHKDVAYEMYMQSVGEKEAQLVEERLYDKTQLPTLDDSFNYDINDFLDFPSKIDYQIIGENSALNQENNITLKEVLKQLEKTNLADNVFLLSNQEIIDKLIELGEQDLKFIIDNNQQIGKKSFLKTTVKDKFIKAEDISIEDFINIDELKKLTPNIDYKNTKIKFEYKQNYENEITATMGLNGSQINSITFTFGEFDLQKSEERLRKEISLLISHESQHMFDRNKSVNSGTSVSRVNQQIRENFGNVSNRVNKTFDSRGKENFSESFGLAVGIYLANKGEQRARVNALQENGIPQEYSELFEPKIDESLLWDNIEDIKEQDFQKYYDLAVEYYYVTVNPAKYDFSFMYNNSNKVMGFIYKNDAYFNKEVATGETYLHEFHHLHLNHLKTKRPEVYTKGISLIETELKLGGKSEIKDVIKYVERTQPNLVGEKKKEEILVQMLGVKGLELINEVKENASVKKGGIIEFLSEIWDMFKDMLGISQISNEELLTLNLNDYARLMNTELLKGEELFVGDEVQEYFTRNADRLPLTLQVFQRPEFVKLQGKEVNPITVLNSLNQIGIKQIEKDLIKKVIKDNYQGQKKISYDELEATVRANIMPLERIFTSSYSDYGMDNLGDGNYGNANTIILNAPIEHGVTGHFSGDFKASGRKNINYVPKQLNDNTWVAVEEGYESQANDNNIYQYVGTAGTKEAVEAWIENYSRTTDNKVNLRNSNVVKVVDEFDPTNEVYILKGESNSNILRRNVSDVPFTDLKEVHKYMIEQLKENFVEDLPVNKGMFGHIRVWQDGEVFNVAELQSDYFQKNNARQSFITKNEEFKKINFKISDLNIEMLSFVPSNLSIMPIYGGINKWELRGLPTVRQAVKLEDLVKMSLRETDSLNENNQNEIDRLVKEVQTLEKSKEKIYEKLSTQEKQFIASQKEWEKRMVREAIKEASLSGATQLRFPTPYTLSVIEGYIRNSSDNSYEYIRGQIGNLQKNDLIIYLEADWIVVNSNQQEFTAINTQTDGIDIFDSKEAIKNVEKINNPIYNSLETLDDDNYYYISTPNDLDIYYYVIPKNIPTEILPQDTGEISKTNKQNFKISNLTETQQTVTKKYEEIAEILKQERGDNFEVVTDENGFDWYSTQIGESEVNNPVIAFQQQAGITKAEAIQILTQEDIDNLPQCK